METLPNAGTAGNVVCTTFYGGSVYGYSVTVSSGTDVTGKDFGNYPLPGSIVTSSGLEAAGLDIDKDPSNGQTFRNIFTPDPSNPTNYYKDTASNSGQFYYNVFYTGSPGPVTITLQIPYPFITQGSNPIQAFGGVSIMGGLFVPLNPLALSPSPSGLKSDGTTALGTLTPSGALAVVPTDYNSASINPGTTFVTLNISTTVPASGIVYVAIHLDYGTKTIGGFTKDSSNGGAHATPWPSPILSTWPAVTITDLDTYTFQVTSPFASAPQIHNVNVFKHDPGFTGVVTSKTTGDPIKGVKVQIYDSSNKLIGTSYTDENGYMYYYKYTGKSTTFTVKLPDYNLKQSVTLKANGFAVVNFQV